MCVLVCDNFLIKNKCTYNVIVDWIHPKETPTTIDTIYQIETYMHTLLLRFE